MRDILIVILFVSVIALVAWEVRNLASLPIMEVSFTTGECMGVRKPPDWNVLHSCDDKTLTKFEVVYVDSGDGG